MAPATQNRIRTTKSSVPRPSEINTFDFQMCFAPQRRAHFSTLNYQKCSGLRCFYPFGFHMCFTPQLRALFQLLNYQKCSGAGVLLPFSFRNVLRATTACTFQHLSTSKSNQVFFNILAWECASRYNGEHFFNISTCKRGSGLKCF